MNLSMKQCKRRLAGLWFGVAAIIFAILYIQTILGTYGESINDVWGWTLPTIMPTLSLSLGVLIMDALGRSAKITTIDDFLYRLTMGLSGVYLVAVCLLFLLLPFSPMQPLKVMQQSNLWLGPFQGLVAAGMGVFFSSAPEP